MNPKAFAKFCKHLEGLTMWSAHAVRGAGSHVSLQCGNKIARARPLTNPRLSEDARKFEGEWSVFIQNAAWRLSERQRVLCSWKSSNAPGAEMVSGLACIVGRTISAVKTVRPADDLILTFEGGFSLVVFADCMDEKEDGANYSVHGPGLVAIVGARGRVSTERKS